MMEMEQNAESNNPDLSYLLFPSGDKLYILYNDVDLSQDPLATGTALTNSGRKTDDNLIFWKRDKGLNFQKAHHFSSSEVAVPYADNQRAGFAIINL